MGSFTNASQVNSICVPILTPSIGLASDLSPFQEIIFSLKCKVGVLMLTNKWAEEWKHRHRHTSWCVASAIWTVAFVRAEGTAASSNILKAVQLHVPEVFS